MMDPLVSLPMLALAFLALFGLAELLFHRFGVKSEWTRKMVHAGTGLLTLLFPILLQHHWQVLVLCSSFLLLLAGSLRFGWLPSINLIDRPSYGSILYPIIVYLVFLFFSISGKGLIVFYLPILILAICDPLAAIVGKRLPSRAYYPWGSRKTVSGSLTFFSAALLISVIAFFASDSTRPILAHRPGMVVMFPLVATLCEAVSVKGTDNFTIPAGTAIVLQLIL